MKATERWMWIAAAIAALAASGSAFSQERTGEAIVNAQCASCHKAGVNGAPRIDDRAAWAPRMKNGLDATVRSAMKGHGAMPARGGLAELSDTELRAAILYMFYPAGATAKYEPAAPAAPADPHRKVVDGIEVYLGILPADSVRTRVAGKAPAGRDYYHINISLRDAKSGAEIKNAQVQARVANPVSGGESKKLEAFATNESTSYGNFFRMSGKQPYTIAVQVQEKSRPAVEAKFEFKP